MRLSSERSLWNAMVLPSSYMISVAKVANFKNATDGILRTFRLAISTTSEYSLDVLTDLGVDVNAEEHIKKTAVLSQINNIVTFLNEVYERDIGITFQLVADNDLIIFFDTTVICYHPALFREFLVIC